MTARKRKREKTEGKGWATKYGKAERNRGRESGRRRKKQPVLCRVESELLLSLLPCISHKTGGWKENGLVIRKMFQLRRSDFVKYRRLVLSWPCSMRRRSLRLLSPDLFTQLGRWYRNVFSKKNYRREFFARKPEAWTWKVSPSELSSSRDLVSEAWLRMAVYGRIWKNYPLNENLHRLSAIVIIFRVPLH